MMLLLRVNYGVTVWQKSTSTVLHRQVHMSEELKHSSGCKCSAKMITLTSGRMLQLPMLTRASYCYTFAVHFVYRIPEIVGQDTEHRTPSRRRTNVLVTTFGG